MFLIDLTASTISHTDLNESLDYILNNLTHSTLYNDQKSTKYLDESSSGFEDALQ